MSASAMDMKPDATDLVDLPGYNKSARNLMPPPENKVEEDNFANAQNMYEEPINGGNQAKDEFQVNFDHFLINRVNQGLSSTPQSKQTWKMRYFYLIFYQLWERNL